MWDKFVWSQTVMINEVWGLAGLSCLHDLLVRSG
jgi:hypothetical protein